MKKLLILFLMLSLIGNCAALAEESETSPVFQCGNLSIELPEGITPLEDSAAYSSAAEMDYGDAFEVCLIAADAAQIRLLTISSAESDEGVKAAAETSATTLLGNADTLTEAGDTGSNCYTFSCSIDSVNYDIYYLGNNTTVYCIVCAGLTDQEKQAMLDSIALS